MGAVISKIQYVSEDTKNHFMKRFSLISQALHPSIVSFECSGSARSEKGFVTLKEKDEFVQLQLPKLQVALQQTFKYFPHSSLLQEEKEFYSLFFMECDLPAFCEDVIAILNDCNEKFHDVSSLIMQYKERYNDARHSLLLDVLASSIVLPTVATLGGPFTQDPELCQFTADLLNAYANRSMAAAAAFKQGKMDFAYAPVAGNLQLKELYKDIIKHLFEFQSHDFADVDSCLLFSRERAALYSIWQLLKGLGHDDVMVPRYSWIGAEKQFEDVGLGVTSVDFYAKNFDSDQRASLLWLNFPAAPNAMEKSFDAELVQRLTHLFTIDSHVTDEPKKTLVLDAAYAFFMQDRSRLSSFYYQLKKHNPHLRVLIVGPNLHKAFYVPSFQGLHCPVFSDDDIFMQKLHRSMISVQAGLTMDALSCLENEQNLDNVLSMIKLDLERKRVAADKLFIVLEKYQPKLKNFGIALEFSRDHFFLLVSHVKILPGVIALSQDQFSYSENESKKYRVNLTKFDPASLEVFLKSLMQQASL